MRILARCVRGVEWIAAAELSATLGLTGVLDRRGVVAELQALDPRLLTLTCVDDLFVVLGELADLERTRAGLAGLAASVARLDWRAETEAVLRLRDRLPTAFDCVVSIEGGRSYNRFEAEDAIGASLTHVMNLPFVSRSARSPRVVADLTVRVFLRAEHAVVALRVGPRPLHRRAWKQATGPGTLHPPLAAALATIGGVSIGTVVVDPFCGDGTLAVEAARRGANVTAFDIDPKRVAATSANARRAGVPVVVDARDAVDLDEVAAAHLMLTNPPWGRQVMAGQRSTSAYWTSVAQVLRGRVAVVTDADNGLPGMLRGAGWSINLANRVRLAGRLADLTLATPPGGEAPMLAGDLVHWRQQAIAVGVATDNGFH